MQSSYLPSTATTRLKCDVAFHIGLIHQRFGQTPALFVLKLYWYDQADRRIGVADVMHDPGNVYWTYTKYDERNLVVGQADTERQRRYRDDLCLQPVRQSRAAARRQK